MTTTASAPPAGRRWRQLFGHVHHATNPPAPVSLAVSAALGGGGAVIKAGVLLKKGHRLPTHKERYVVLTPKLLSYFRAKGHADGPPTGLKGVLELGPADVVTPVATSRHWFVLHKLHGPDGRPYKLELRAASPEDRQQWIDAIRNACRDPPLALPHSLRETEMERRAACAMTVLRVRDPAVAKSVLRAHPPPTAATNDLRATFHVLHELALLQELVDRIHVSWGHPSTWSPSQYDELVQAICLAQQTTEDAAPTTLVREEGSILGAATALRYAFEEIPENQEKLLSRHARLQSTTNDEKMKSGLTPLLTMTTPAAIPEPPRCPTIYSYLSTFERLSTEFELPASSNNVDDTELHRSSTASRASISARSSVGASGPLTPRSATLAKYAHLYMREEGRQTKPWSWMRENGDDIKDIDLDGVDGMIEHLLKRFNEERVHTYVGHQMMLFLNPKRILKTAKFMSIFDEQVVLVYSQTPFAQIHLAPHPFGVAKQSLIRLFFKEPSVPHSMVLSGDSGSGKTELTKELLKYIVLTAQPPVHGEKTKVVLYTSSTKSTFQMRYEESRTLDLLQAKGITDYSVVLLDLHRDRWNEMISVSKSKRLPQVHINGVFFGFYESLQRLEDEEQLRMYFKNPEAAVKLSSVLDSNILLEAFGHASTSRNRNSSRYVKVVDLHLDFGNEPSIFQVQGCELRTSLLEKTRITSDKAASGDSNFHIFYALLAASNDPGAKNAMVQNLHLDGVTNNTFNYLSQSSVGTNQDSIKMEIERFQSISHAMNSINIAPAHQDSIYQILSAILWLGNLNFSLDINGGSRIVKLDGLTHRGSSIEGCLCQLLSLNSVDDLRRLFCTRTVEFAATSEIFEVELSVLQAYNIRDTFARLLYDIVFTYIVRSLNEMTNSRISPALNSRILRIVDTFGFENLKFNSLEQLCINYMTEKLAASEQHVVQAMLGCEGSRDEVLDRPLHLFEHPLGIFATLEEQTRLHQADDWAIENEQKKNEVFTRYVCQRNNELTPTTRLRQLAFTVPHTRDVVEYDARDFVRKNAELQYPQLLETFRLSRDPSKQELLRVYAGAKSLQTGVRSSITRIGSFTSQFRTQILHQIDIAHRCDYSPVFIHCLDPNGESISADGSKHLRKQLKAQLIGSSRQIARETSHLDVTVRRHQFLARYRSLLGSCDEHDNDSLANALVQLVRKGIGETVVVVDANQVKMQNLVLIELLEVLRNERRHESATRIQSYIRMHSTRQWFMRVQSDRKVIERQLIDLYGACSRKKIEMTLLKYVGREKELLSIIAEKLKERDLVTELKSEIETLLDQPGAGLGPLVFDELVRDAEIKNLLVENERVMPALREMSLNPHALEKQLADPSLRAFYQRIIAIIQKRSVTSEELPGGECILRQQERCHEDLGLEDSIRQLLTKRRDVWDRVANDDTMKSIRDQLNEIAEAPEVLMFYLDDLQFVDQLKRFLRLASEISVNGKGCSEDIRPVVPPSQLVVNELMSVEFTADLMAAMQGDPFFIRALQDPVLVTAVHQFMRDRQGFINQGDVRDAGILEFFTRLIRLHNELRRS